MNLIQEWKHVLKHAWSIRFAVLTGLFAGIDVALPLFVDTIPRGVFSALAMFSAIGGAVSRVVEQPKMERRAKPRGHDDVRPQA